MTNERRCEYGDEACGAAANLCATQEEQELDDLANQALLSLRSRQGEDIGSWADMLINDPSKWND